MTSNPWRILATLMGIALVSASIIFNPGYPSSALQDPVLTPFTEIQKDSSVVSNTPMLGYKQLMFKPYQQTLQTMHNVKEDTLALQGRKMSLSAYKSSILQSQATFTELQAFTQANPPTEAYLLSPYQDFLAGISLANESMSVVLKGLSSFSRSDFDTAREMGKRAQQQIINGYSLF